jgi:ribonuclease HI
VLIKTAWFVLICSVDIGEALGLCEALQWVVELGLDNMDFSLNSKLVVDVVTSNNSSKTNFGSIIVLKTHFTNHKVV